MQVFDKFDNSRGFYEHIKEEDEISSKSLLFNSFIFMQVFNEINSRKILDEYNIFEGMFKSFIFVGVLALTVVLQIIIMETPVGRIFHVNSLDSAISSLHLFNCCVVCDACSTVVCVPGCFLVIDRCLYLNTVF